MMQEKAGDKKQNSKKGFDKNEQPAAWREFFWFQIPLPDSGQCQSVFNAGQSNSDKSKLV